MSLYDIEVETITGETTRLSQWAGKTLLVVNTASRCGFTPQFEGLESLYRRFGERGLVVLGFPCNQFGSQEPLDEEGIQQFCSLNYGVTFPMFARVEVNGENEHPLFALLKDAAPGILGTRAIKWNFTKFLVNDRGQVVARFAPQDKPDDIAREIESHLRPAVG